MRDGWQVEEVQKFILMGHSIVYNEHCVFHKVINIRGAEAEI